MNEEEIRQLEAYYKEIDFSENAENADKLFYNSDRAHNALVMSRIFQRSQEVNMYCGKLSLFGKEFARRVKQDLGLDDAPAGHFSPMAILYESVKQFLSAGKRLTVIVERNPDEFEDDIKFIRLYNNFHLYKIPVDSQAEFHFSVGDGIMYRRELDKGSHTAICCFNDREGAEIMNEQFRYRLTLSQTVS